MNAALLGRSWIESGSMSGSKSKCRAGGYCSWFRASFLSMPRSGFGTWVNPWSRFRSRNEYL